MKCELRFLVLFFWVGGGVGVFSALLLMADKVNLKEVSKITESNILVQRGRSGHLQSERTTGTIRTGLED